MRVFVLGTGRCGTTTFARACGHLSNYTSAHESRSAMIGSDRLAYPDAHIEVDNRLAWFLGDLGRRYDDTDVLYVHLLRDPAEVAASFAKRWDSSYAASLVRSFAHGLVARAEPWPPEEVLEVCGFLVDTVTSNIREYLRSRESVEIWLDEIGPGFDRFVELIGGEGDLVAARAELATRHNASRA